jgi:hypothetical protein
MYIHRIAINFWFQILTMYIANDEESVDVEQAFIFFQLQFTSQTINYCKQVFACACCFLLRMCMHVCMANIVGLIAPPGVSFTNQSRP